MSFDLLPTSVDADDSTPTVAAVPTQPQPPTTPPAPAPAAAPPALDHTPGGLPAIPLAIITSNTAIAGLSAAAIVGGPLAAGVVGAAAAAGVVAGVSRKSRAQSKSRTAAARRTAAGARTSAGRSTAARSAGGAGGGKRAGGGAAGRKAGTSTSRTTAAGARRTGTASALNSTGTRPRTGKPGTATARTGLKPPTTTEAKTKGAGKAAGSSSANKPRTGAASTAGKGRLGQIKALRKARKADAPTRKAERAQATTARRALADTRRADKNAAKQARKAAKAAQLGKTGPGLAGETAGAATAKTGSHKRLAKAVATKANRGLAASRTKTRDALDKNTQSRAGRIRQARRNAQARARMSRSIAASGLRYTAKCVGAALLAAPVGLLGCLTTPLGRKLGWSALMHPGRRLYRRLTARAKYNHAARVADAKNTYAYVTDPASIDLPEPITATVPRGPRARTGPTLISGDPVSEALKFLFDESAADMEAAAQAYEPGGMIHVYQTIQGMPAGIQSWANTFKILAEKSDDSFPLEPEVGEALGEVFELLQKAAQASEEVQKVFEEKHEHDLERLNAPRKSLEAEKAWDASTNEEYL